MYQLAAPASAEIEVKKSRFIGMVFPVASRAEAKQRLAELRAQHPGAVHHCWVLICDGDSGLDDDGEPSGTAARPMYNVLSHKSVSNILAVVVRYWGGTKLGAGGLARAYGQAVTEAMKVAELVAFEPMGERRLTFAFADEAAVRRLAEQRGAVVLAADYGEAVTLTLRIKLADADAFIADASDLLRGALTVRDPS
ncbi:IMPACT family protein [Crenobacter cavernae]|uniref:YigZ family protein n=1 Tax=Crenobacter cavernae TaxID=2290923 RepID=A0ABY0F9M8_9NEIS|nr:YigZ family protein [Crenobacter cavernae]RXZ42179.1 YigZ family protein [Crenobacter cavernae]